MKKSIISSSIISLEYEFVEEDWQSLFEGNDFLQITRWVAVQEGDKVQISEVGEPEEFTITSEFQLPLPTTIDVDKVVRIGEKWSSNGIDFYPIIFDPLRYDRTTAEFKLTTNIKLEVELPATPPPLHRLSRSARSMWGDLLINNRTPSRDDHNSGGGYVYVVPADEDVREIMEDLYEWRRMQGYKVVEFVLPGRLQGAISGLQLHANLVDMHENDHPIEYICLVGDTGGEFIVPTTIHGTSDYHFALLEGDDPLPDAAVGRLSYNSLGELRRMVAKILQYEREPDVDNMGWLERGAVIAGNQISGLSTILVSKWVRDQMLSNGFTQVDTLWYTMDLSVEESFRRSINAGVSYITYRGWTGLEDFTPREAGRLANRTLPVAILLGCSTGDFDGRGAGYTEALLRAEGGAIGAIGNATLQGRVNYNNALMAGFFKGVFDDGAYRLGWMLNRAKMELFATYGVVGRQNAISHAYWANLMGDPGTIIWSGIPREVEIEVDEEIEISNDPVRVRVTHEGEGLSGVKVGLYKVGEIVASAYTDEEGVAIISYLPMNVSDGVAFVTVSGDRILPTTQEINILPAEEFIVYVRHTVDDFGFGEPIRGNGDGIMQPLEIFYLYVTTSNIGGNIINGPLTMTLSTEHPEIELIDVEVEYEDDFQLDQEIRTGFLIGASGSFPDREEVQFAVTINSEAGEWTLPFSAIGEAAKLEFNAFTPGDVRFDLGADINFGIEVINNGSIDIDQSDGILESLSEWVEVTEDIGDYGSIRAGEIGGSGEVFGINIDFETPFGEILLFQLNFETEAGIFQTVQYEIKVGENPNDYPSGPDEYGYWAIGDSDFDSNIRPDYRWTEINPNINRGPGEDTGLLDQGEDDDKSVVLHLPFQFQYYGEVFDQLTVCTNGWAAFGSQADYLDFRNLAIGTPQGPSAQLCPWWDDLYQPGANGGVYYWYDVAEHRFIVEWYRMSRYVGPSGPGDEETFQLILLDPDWHATNTGDGDIIFQYNDVTNSSRVDVHGTPYATIGIGDLDDKGGLEYSFWDRWAAGARPVDWHNVIRFATSSHHVYGSISGDVTSLSNGEILEGAVIRASTGNWVISDENGRFDSLYVLVDLPFTLIASRQNYNAVETGEMQIGDGEFVVADFGLPNPLIELSVDVIVDTLDAQEQIEHPFQIINNGNGELDFEIDFIWLEDGERISNDKINPNQLNHDDPIDRDDPDELWEHLFGWDVTEATGDHRILGAVYFNERFAVSGGANGEAENIIYLFNGEGEETGRIDQPCNGIWGLHDLAYNDGNLYGGCRDQIYVMDNNGQVIETIESPLVPAVGLAVEPNGNIWIANDGDPIHQLDSDGNTLRVYNHRLRPYGLAWHPAERDGYSLYIFSADGETNMAISKLNPETGDIVLVTIIELEAGDRAGGCEFTVDWDTRRWTLITVIQNPDGDRVELFDAGPNLSWISADPVSGVVQGEQELEVTLTISAENLDRGEYQLDMIISHNAIGGDIHVPIELSVEPQFVSVGDGIPAGFTLNSIFPNPANSSTRIDFSLSQQSNVKLTIWDNQGRKVSDLYELTLSAGNHSLPFNGINLPSGIYIVQLEMNGAYLSRKFVLLK